MRKEDIVYQHRWFDTLHDTVTSGEWSEWENCTEARYHEMREYIDRGYQFQVRVLCAMYYIPSAQDVAKYRPMNDTEWAEHLRNRK